MIYNYILEAISVNNQLGTKDLLHDYLASLQENVKALRNAYNSFPVNFDYSNENNQAAYLITYFPHYTAIITRILDLHSEDINTYKFPIQDLYLFGGGQCPELVGYLNFLQLNDPNQSYTIRVVNIDIAADTWAYSRDMNWRSIVPHYMGKNIIPSFNIFKKNIAEPLKLKSSEERVPKIVVFQNCLNEVATLQHKQIIDNFRTIFDALPNESTIIIADLVGYSAVFDLIQEIETDLANLPNFSLIHSVASGITSINSPFAIQPQVIKEHLLIGIHGLIPKRYLRFIYSVIYKTPILYS